MCRRILVFLLRTALLFSWTFPIKASLPSSLGGLNIRWASLHAPAAYIGSFLHSKPLILQIWAILLSHPSTSLPPLMTWLMPLLDQSGSPSRTSTFLSSNDASPMPLMRLHLQLCWLMLLTLAPDSRSRALAFSSAIRHARDWLNVVPSSALGFHLQDWEFHPCVQYWLGLQMSVEGSSCPVCHSVADPFGDHQVGCGGNGDRIYRHDALRDAVFSAAQTAALVPWIEMSLLIPDTQRRPADVFLPNWKRGRMPLWMFV